VPAVVDLTKIRFHAGVQLLHLLFCNQQQNAINARKELDKTEKMAAPTPTQSAPSGPGSAATAAQPQNKEMAKRRSTFETILKLRGVAFNVLRDKHNSRGLNWGRRIKRRERRNLEDVFVARLLAEAETAPRAIKDFLSLSRQKKAARVVAVLDGFRGDGNRANAPPPHYRQFFSVKAKAERKAARCAAKERTAAEQQQAVVAPPQQQQAALQPALQLKAEAPVDEDEDDDVVELEAAGADDDEEEDGEDEQETEAGRLSAALAKASIYGTVAATEQAADKPAKEQKAAHVTLLFPGAEATYGAPHVLLTRGALVDVANRVLDRFRVSRHARFAALN
jgi:hypothetical protein